MNKTLDYCKALKTLRFFNRILQNRDKVDNFAMLRCNIFANLEVLRLFYAAQICGFPTQMLATIDAN